MPSSKGTWAFLIWGFHFVSVDYIFVYCLLSLWGSHTRLSCTWLSFEKCPSFPLSWALFSCVLWDFVWLVLFCLWFSVARDPLASNMPFDMGWWSVISGVFLEAGKNKYAVWWCLIKMWNVYIQRNIFDLCTYVDACMCIYLAVNCSEPLSCFPVLAFTVPCLLQGKEKAGSTPKCHSWEGFCNPATYVQH